MAFFTAQIRMLICRREWDEYEATIFPTLTQKCSHFKIAVTITELGFDQKICLIEDFYPYTLDFWWGTSFLEIILNQNLGWVSLAFFVRFGFGKVKFRGVRIDEGFEVIGFLLRKFSWTQLSKFQIDIILELILLHWNIVELLRETF